MNNRNMADSKQFVSVTFNGCLEKYRKVQKLIHEEKKTDPENEPYRSMYTAKDLLTEIKDDLVRVADGAGLQETVLQRVNILIAAINYSLGSISIEIEELSAGEEFLKNCEEATKNHELSSECIMLVMFCLTQQGILWSMRDEVKKSAEYLERSESLCKSYREKNGRVPYDIPDLFSLELDNTDEQLEKNWVTFEKTLTHTFYYLAQVYKSLGQTVKSAIYCHTTLRRQLESNDYDPIDWAINAATLSQFFVGQSDFEDARHHLASATCVLDTFEKSQSDGVTRERSEDILETIGHRKADIARCWGKYGLLLLSVSWDSLLRNSVSELVDAADANGINKDPDSLQSEVNDENLEKGLTDINEASLQPYALDQSVTGVDFEKRFMTFKSLEVAAIEKQITAKRVLDFDQARAVFLFTQKWLNVAKGYYTLQDHASDHVLIVSDFSKLYRMLAYFESNEVRCCKMHKRRIDMLEAVLEELNPQYYLNACQQLQFELGDVYNEMMGLKLARLESESDRGERHHITKKVNHLIEKSLKYFRMFLDTMKQPNGDVPEKFSDDVVRPVLLAHFLIARLHSKVITVDQNEQLQSLKNSIHHYTYVCDYCEKFPSVAELMKEELWVSKEMVLLLPKKMDKILCGSFCN